MRVKFLLPLILIIISGETFAWGYPILPSQDRYPPNIKEHCDTEVSNNLRVIGDISFYEKKSSHNIYVSGNKGPLKTGVEALNITDCVVLIDMETSFRNQARHTTTGKWTHPTGVHIYYNIKNCNSLTRKNGDDCDIFFIRNDKEQFVLGPMTGEVSDVKCFKLEYGFNKCTYFLDGITIYVFGEFEPSLDGYTSIDVNYLLFSQISNEVWLRSFKGKIIPKDIIRGIEYTKTTP